MILRGIGNHILGDMMADEDIIEVNDYEVVDKKEIIDEDNQNSNSYTENDVNNNFDNSNYTPSRTYYSSSDMGLSGLLIIPLVLLIIIVVFLMVFM